MTAKRRIALGSAITVTILACVAMATARRGSMAYNNMQWMAWEHVQIIRRTTDDNWRQVIVNLR